MESPAHCVPSGEIEDNILEKQRHVMPVIFTAPSKSQLVYRLTSAVGTGRLSIYRDEDANQRELFHQLSTIRYNLRQNQQIEFEAPSSRDHDDCVMVLALAVEASNSATPHGFGGIVRGVDPLHMDRSGPWGDL